MTISLIVLLVAAGAKEPPTPATDEGLVAVLVREGAEPAWLRADLPLSEEDAAATADFSYFWVWSPNCAPMRASRSDVAGFNCAPARRFVEVHLERPSRRAGSEPERHPPLVLAAPLDSWIDLPEDLLPSWQVRESDRVRVPAPVGARLRIRVVGDRVGSGWYELGPATDVVRIRLSPAEGRKVAVRDEAGRPAPDAVVVLGAIEGRAARFRSFARKQGEGVVSLFPLPGTELIEALFRASSGLPVRFRGEARRLPQVVTLPGGCALDGQVTDSAGKPLGGAFVEAEGVDGDGIVASALAATDANGGFRLPALPRSKVALAARADGYERRVVQVDLALCNREWRAEAVVLRPARTLTLLVVDPDGAPIAGASVRSGDGRSQETDRRGIARLEEVGEASSLSLRVHATRFLARELLARPAEVPTRVVLDRAATLEGVLVDDRGRPVGDGECEVRWGPKSTTHSLEESGSIEIDVPPEVRLDLRCRGAATLPAERTVRPLGAGEVHDLGRVTTARGLTVRGRLVEEATRVPVAGARVWAPRATAVGAVVAWARGNVATTSSSADGSFALTGIPSQPAALRVDARGLAPREVSFAPDPEAAEHDLGEIALAAGGTVEVVTDPSWRGVARADWKGEWRESDMISAYVLGGYAALDHVPAGRATVSVIAEGKLLCETTVTVPEGGLVAADCEGPSLLVEGIVRVGGRPAGPGRLIWLSGAGGETLIINRSSRLGLAHQQVHGAGRPQVDVLVSRDGRFSSDELGAGMWEVLWFADEGGPRPQKRVELPSAETVFVELAFPGMHLFGRVTDEGGEPIAGARVVEMTSPVTTRSLEDGTFDLTGPATGQAVLQAFDGEAASEVVRVEIGGSASGEPIELVIDRRENDRLAVRVRADAVPVAGALVFVEEATGGLRILTADARGEAAIGVAALDGSAIRASAFGRGVWGTSPWLAATAARRDGVTLDLSGTGQLLLSAPSLEAEPEITGPGGWPLTGLLRHAGMPRSLAPGSPLLLAGLPPGSYAVRVGAEVQEVLVRSGELTALELP